METNVVSSDPSPSTKIDLRRLWWVGPLIMFVAVLANLLVRAISLTLFEVSAEFAPFQIPRIVFLTAVGVGLAVVVFAVVARRAQRPLRTFRVIAIIALLLSFIPDIGLLVTDVVPGTTAPAVATLMVMHVVSAAIAVIMLERLATRG